MVNNKRTFTPLFKINTNFRVKITYVHIFYKGSSNDFTSEAGVVKYKLG